MQDFSVDDNAVLTLADGTKKYYTCMGILRCERGKKAYTWNGSAFAPLSKEDVACVSCATSGGSEVYVAYFKHNFTIESRSIISSVKK